MWSKRQCEKVIEYFCAFPYFTGAITDYYFVWFRRTIYFYCPFTLQFQRSQFIKFYDKIKNL